MCVSTCVCVDLPEPSSQFPTPLPAGLRLLGLQCDKQEREGPHDWAQLECGNGDSRPGPGEQLRP